MENIKHCYIANRSPLFIKLGKKTAQFAVQVYGSEKSFAVAEAQKITANVPQTCGFAVADFHCYFAKFAVAE